REDFRLSVRELARGELNAPVRQVVDWRLADEMGEAPREGRAREGDLVGELVERPRLSRSCVQQGEGPTDFRIAETRQPPGLVGRQCVQIAPHHLDEE